LSIIFRAQSENFFSTNRAKRAKKKYSKRDDAHFLARRDQNISASKKNERRASGKSRRKPCEENLSVFLRALRV
jgi:hypothetical protein